MSKWPNVSPEKKKAAFRLNAQHAKNKESAEDFFKLLAHLPPGQVKNLLKDEACGAILRKYGISGEGQV